MATNATFPPYEMTTDAGTIEGIDVDTAQAIAEKLGLELQIDDMDFDAALLSVQQGKADIAMAGITVTDERMAVMSFSDSYATGIQLRHRARGLRHCLCGRSGRQEDRHPARHHRLPVLLRRLWRGTPWWPTTTYSTAVQRL